MRVRKAEREDYRRMVLGIGEYAPPTKSGETEIVTAPKKKTSFSEQMFDFVNRSGKTRKEIADRIEVDIHTVSAWMNGKNLPLKYQLEELEAYLDATFSPRPICIKDPVNYFMKKNELSAKDFCELTGLSIGQFRCMANVNRLTSYEDVLKLAEALGVDSSYFYNFSKDAEVVIPDAKDEKEEPMDAISENKVVISDLTSETERYIPYKKPERYSKVDADASFVNDVINYFVSDCSGLDAYYRGTLINLIINQKFDEAKELLATMRAQ